MNQESRQSLLERILASRHFANADSLKRILRYLCARSQEVPGAQIKEFDIAINVLGRTAAFDPKVDPIVRVSIASVRERLRAYFENEGRAEALRLAIPKGQYRAVFTTSKPPAEAPPAFKPRGPALDKFWRPYLTGARENILIFTELLFLRSDEGDFLRNIYVNDLSAAREQLQERFPGLKLDKFRPTFHFASAGEVMCLLSLVRLFTELGVRIETRNSRFSSWTALRQANVILLGSARTNSFSDSLQGGNDFVIKADHIANLAPRAGEESVYRGARFTDGKLEKLTEYALVTRRPSLTPGCFITLIAANHGRAIEGAGDFLTHEDKLQELLITMQLAETDSLPPHFQLLLRVDMIDFDEEVVGAQYITHRIYQS
jgi:hypothetical protein